MPRGGGAPRPRPRGRPARRHPSSAGRTAASPPRTRHAQTPDARSPRPGSCRSCPASRNTAAPRTRVPQLTRVLGRVLGRTGRSAACGVLSIAGMPRYTPDRDSADRYRLGALSSTRTCGPRRSGIRTVPRCLADRTGLTGRAAEGAGSDRLLVHDLEPDHRPATSALTSTKPPLRQRKEQTSGPVEPRPPGPPAGLALHPHPLNQDQSLGQAAITGQPFAVVNDQGLSVTSRITSSMASIGANRHKTGAITPNQTPRSGRVGIY